MRPKAAITLEPNGYISRTLNSSGWSTAKTFTEPGIWSNPTASAPRAADMVRNLLDRGVTDGVFRDGIDPVQLNITIAAIGYYYLTNRYTGAILFERDFIDKDALDQRLRFNIDTVMRLVERRPVPAGNPDDPA